MERLCSARLARVYRDYLNQHRKYVSIHIIIIRAVVLKFSKTKQGRVARHAFTPHIEKGPHDFSIHLALPGKKIGTTPGFLVEYSVDMAIEKS